jgi:hypothetical protein
MMIGGHVVEVIKRREEEGRVLRPCTEHRKLQNNKLRVVKSAGLSCGDDGGCKTPVKKVGSTWHD